MLMHNLKDLEKIVCPSPKCNFVIQRKIGIIRKAGFLWYFHSMKTPDRKSDWAFGYYDISGQLKNVLRLVDGFYCPACCRILPDTVKIKVVLKRYLVMQKLEGHKKRY